MSQHNQNPDPELLSLVNHFFIESSPVNRGLGLRIRSLDPANPQIDIDMRDDLVGLVYAPMLHGGIIASALDAVGSLTVFLGIIAKMKTGSTQEKVERLRQRSRLNTIDLRVDYLRPGRGSVFTASGRVLRTGTKVGVARMEMHNEAGHLIAVGTGTYLVG